MTTPQPTSTPDDLQARLRALFKAFVAVGDPEQLREFWREVPAELEQPLIEIVEARIEERTSGRTSGRSALSAPTAETAETESLRAKLADFKHMCEEAEQERAMPPVQRAVVAFLQAPDEAAARAWFASQRTLLQPFEAQQVLDTLAAQTPSDARAEVRQRLAERAALLRQLRGASAQPAQAVSQPENLQSATFDNRQMQIGGNLYQAREINITNVYELQWRWLRPEPPELPKDLVERSADIEAVIKKIRAQGVVAISGVKSASGPTALTMQGMPGVGKTSLARLLAKRLDAEYPDGVLWADVGPSVQKREDAAAILKTWAGFYVGGIEDQALAFTPEAVRALMAEHPKMLVILDNVWSLDAIKPLREALPPGTHHILTTRSLEIMRHAGGASHQVGLLSDADALALVELRLKWRPEENSAGAAWVGELIARLEHHPLALDIALGLMVSEGLEPAEWRETAQRVVNQVQSGSDFGDLKLPHDIDRDANVEAALLVSYEFLDVAVQARLRQLGALAPEAGFSAAQAAAIWQCEEAEARRQLMALFNRSLLERRADGLWGQHAILRGYALALLRRAGEYEAAAARHAEAYDEAMRAADDAQRYHELLPAYAQLAHAFEWAVDNDLDRALSLIGNCANLQAQFGKARDGLNWSQRALTAAQARGAPAGVARAQGSLANALARAAALPGEDRRARLVEALAAYDDALRFRRPENAPLDYATTQNNRAVLLSDLATVPGEDRRARLLEALQCAVVAVALFEQYQQAQYLEVGKRVLKNLREACGVDFAAFWAQAGLGPPPDWLMRDESEQQPDPLQAALAAYLEQREQAANAEADPAAWQRAADAGEGLLSLLGAAGAAGEGVDELKADIASAYNSLGNALDESDKRAALAAYERAIALQPGFAMWHRNRAGTLIELGRLDEAAAAIARARELEPNAPRLAKLDAQLAQARGSEE